MFKRALVALTLLCASVVVPVATAYAKGPPPHKTPFSDVKSKFVCTHHPCGKSR
jgi:hypothetical protein